MNNDADKPSSVRWRPRECVLAAIAALTVCAWLVVSVLVDDVPDSLSGATGLLGEGHLASVLKSVGEPLDVFVGAREAAGTPYAQWAFQEFRVETQQRPEVYALVARFHKAIADDLESRGCKLTGQGTGGHYLGNPISTIYYSRGPIAGGVMISTFVKEGGVTLVYYAFENPQS